MFIYLYPIHNFIRINQNTRQPFTVNSDKCQTDLWFCASSLFSPTLSLSFSLTHSLFNLPCSVSHTSVIVVIRGSRPGWVYCSIFPTTNICVLESLGMETDILRIHLHILLFHLHSHTHTRLQNVTITHHSHYLVLYHNITTKHILIWNSCPNLHRFLLDRSSSERYLIWL